MGKKEAGFWEKQISTDSWFDGLFFSPADAADFRRGFLNRWLRRWRWFYADWISNAPFDKPIRQAQGAKRINWNKLAGARKKFTPKFTLRFPPHLLEQTVCRRHRPARLQRLMKDLCKIRFSFKKIFRRNWWFTHGNLRFSFQRIAIFAYLCVIN